MKRQDAFNKLFEMGTDYESYQRRGHRHKDKHEIAINAVSTDIANLPSDKVELLNKAMRVMLIGEIWCGDCARAVPVMSKFAEKFEKWDYRIVGKDDITDEDLLDNYTTAGRVKIPVIVFADEDGDEIARWVERPKRSYRLLVKLQNERLPKEEYIAKYKSIPELQTESIAKEVLRELLEVAEYAATLLHIMPKKRIAQKPI